VQTVPKFAATLASLLLIASSIGVNIARYPQVGPTAANEPPINAIANGSNDPGEAGLTQSTTAVDLASSPEAKNRSPLTKSGAELPERRPPVAVANRADVPPPPQGREVPILDVRPLVPVGRKQTTGSPAEFSELHRLPAVDPAISACAENAATGIDANATYPATITP
jgi:hypothetical protein